MKIFFTKYALSSGISEIEVEKVRDDGTFIYDRFFSSGRIGRDGFYTRDEAVQNAEERRVAKIASLERQIAKLKKIQF